MGATSSTTYKSVQRNPTRNIRTTLSMNENNQTFTFTQEMDKSLAEEQTLKTSLQLSGKIERIATDIEVNGRIVKGNPQYRLITTKGKFETRWGDRFYQVKRGQLQLLAPKPLSPSIMNQLKSSLQANKKTITGLDVDDEDAADVYYSLDKIEMDENPWMNSPRQQNARRSQPPQVQSAINQNSTNVIDPKSSKFDGSRRRAGSTGTVDEKTILTQYLKPKPEITVVKNGVHMNDLINCRNIEAMNALLKVDIEDWLASFTSSALDMHITILSDTVLLNYHKPKFEYLWAQLQDESPILMSLCSLSYDDQAHQLHFPLKTVN